MLINDLRIIMKYFLLVLFILISVSFTDLFPQKSIKFDYVGEFREGMCPVKQKDKWGFIDTEGNLVIEPVWNSFITPFFSSGVVRLQDPKTAKHGFLDKKGNTVIPFSFYSINDFHDTVTVAYFPASAADKNSKAQCRAVLILAGIELPFELPNDYSYSTYFTEGLARARVDSKYGYMNVPGMLVIPNIYYDVKDFSNGMASVSLARKWGVIDSTGSMVFEPQYYTPPMPFSGGYGWFNNDKNRFGLIDRKGKVLIDPYYEKVFMFGDGFGTAYTRTPDNDEITHIIGDSGKVAVEFRKSVMKDGFIIPESGFNDGLAAARIGYSKYGFIDTKGKTAVDFRFSMVKAFNSGRAYAEYKDPKTNKLIRGFINTKGDFVIILE